jgi:superfamily II DNA/RNA helicase
MGNYCGKFREFDIR